MQELKYFALQSPVHLREAMLTVSTPSNVRTKPNRAEVRTVATLVVAIVLLTAPFPAVPQQISQQQIEQARQNPELVRQRIQQSGLSSGQIRSMLSAAGYSPDILDAYLSAAPGDPAPDVSVETLGALEALGIEPLPAEGLVPVPLLVGQQVVDSLEPVPPLYQELTLFGADVFTRSPTLFQPDLGGPVPADYRLGPGDQLVLVLTGDVELLRELQVTRQGFIIVPDVGQIAVNNLTMEEFRSLMRRRLSASYSGILTGTTQFDVTVTRLRTNQVFVAGEVQQPGAYQLSSVATVLNALYAAGGLTDLANFREIAVRRQGTTVTTYDFYDLLLQGNTANDIMLQSGDVVFVPVHGIRASISGAVVRPAIYELKDGQTLRDLIDAAGGFRADAALQRISVSRIIPPSQRVEVGPQRIVVDVQVQRDDNGAPPPFPIEAGDSVTVFGVEKARRSFVELNGAVYHPGTFGWYTGMRLSDLIELAGGFRPATFSGRAHIERINILDSTRQMLSAELPADSSQPYPDDLLLEDYDIVTVYGRDEFREERTVSIGGMVKEPGAFPYRSGMTLRDLVIQARGLRDGALLDSVEVARLPQDRRGGMLAVRLSARMDSTYLLEPRNSTYEFLPGLEAPSAGAPEFILKPLDRVTVFRQPEYELHRSVEITGEILYPGPYTLTRKDETVNDLVNRAGGLLNTAYAEGAQFFRQLLQVDTAGVETVVASQVNLDLAGVLNEPGSGDDIVLQPGDSLHVPEYQPTVRVEGAVHAPTTVVFRNGAALDYYIGNAGGTTSDADEGRVSVRYANGSAAVKRKFLFFGTSPTPGPGSTVFVPEKSPKDRIDVVALFGSISQVLAAAVTVIVVATR